MISVQTVWLFINMKRIDTMFFISCQSAKRALAVLSERLIFVTPDLLRKSTPEGLVYKNIYNSNVLLHLNGYKK